MVGRKEVLVLAISLGVGLGVEFVPELFRNIPENITRVFQSGITSGGLTAIVVNAILSLKRFNDEDELIESPAADENETDYQ